MEKKFLVLIFVLALFLRVYKLNEFPAGLNADEAAIGYNAYSLLVTGKDEFGHSWPLNFQSFNDYKPGLYFYLVLPWVKSIGLNEWSVRLPSAILGSLTILIIYLLVKEIFRDNRLALLSSFLLAISPWHVHFSRGGWETNVATFFIALGSWLFFLALKKPKYFLFCALSFALSMFTYHSARVVTPLLGLGLVVINFRQVVRKANVKGLLAAAAVGGILLLFLFFSMTGGAGVSRFSGVGLFVDQGPFWRVNELRGQHADPYGFPVKLVHNKVIEYGKQFFDNWLRHYSGNFLFISGDEIQRNRVPEMGQMYLVEIPFLILGFYFLLKNKPFGWQTVLWWLSVAPVASAMTFQSPHAIRSLNMVIPLVVINAYGLGNLFYLSKKQLPKFVCFLLFAFCSLLLIWNFGFYLHQYYVHYPQTYPAAWEYGFKDLAVYVAEKQSRFEKIYITDKYDQPYILLAFYLKYPPEKFQSQARLTPRDKYGFSTVGRFDKFYFGPIDFSHLEKEKNSLIIGTAEEIPESATIDRKIFFKDGKTEAFRIVEK